MTEKKKEHPAEKTVLHQRNKHRERYDFKQLVTTCPELGKYVKLNPYGDESIDFANPKAVKWLNKSLLKKYYSLEYWDIPTGYLCPPIPGRADYIHTIADVLGSSNHGKIPTGYKVKCMDIGVGASCIYPVIGNKEYGWSFIGCDIDEKALESANKIISYNAFLQRNIELRFQENPKDIFHGVMLRNEPIDVAICNPPFHTSAEEAQKGTLRKLSSLNKTKVTTPVLNFGGQSNELWCDGGEERFVRDMIRQSKQFSANCFWFSTLIAKKEHLAPILEALKTAGATDIKTIEMGQGTKISRIVAWTFLTPTQQKRWIDTRWNAF
jgi:23S rRNA (adenine1618-N6)-methyltransferase